MNLKYLKYFFILPLLVAVSVTLAAENGDKNKRVNKTAGEPVYKLFNINQISTWIKNDGESDINPNGNSGFVYPKGSNKAAIFQAGFLWGGVVDGQVRVGGSVYRQGLVPGKILNSGVPADQLTAESPDAPNVRNYRVRPDWREGSVQAEINDGEGSESEIRAAYEADWNEWPWQDGAPYEDVDSNGVYDPTIDVPGVPGADQTIWFVSNDTDEAQTQFMYGSPSMGIEMQATIWGYNQAGPLGSMMFRKYKIINKSSTPFQDMYVSMWNDPDLGDAGDDFVGCDTILSMTYVYNATAEDATYGSQPAAAGFDFFQGPIVDGEPTDSAIFGGHVIYGKKNLPMTAHYFFINQDPIYTDPPQGVYLGTQQWYNLLRGRLSTTGEEFPVPAEAGGGTTPFALAGDPIAETGWIDGMQHAPGDRRAGMASGPFTMAPGDTQEIVVAEIAAIGADNLGSVTLLKSYDAVAQDAYDKFFILPSAPRAPQVTARGLDQEVVLTWGENQTVWEETESNDVDGYTFQGYNVYQFSDRTGSDRRKIATYDIIDGVKTVVGKDIDPATGAEIQVVQQAGNDVGIKHYISIKRDYIRNTNLANGRRYYFAVTAYSYNPDPNIVPNNLENPVAIIEIVPESPNPGARYEGASGDSIVVGRVSGASDGSVTAVVVDPSQTTGHTYRVNFREIVEDDVPAIVWDLTDEATGQTVLEAQHNQEENGAYPVVDGLQVKALGPPLAVAGYSFTPSADRWFTGVNFGGEAFFGGLSIGPNFFGSSVTAAQYVTVEMRFVTDKANGQRAYNYVRGGDPSYGYVDYELQHFTMWDVDNNRQLAVGYVEQAGSEANNSLWQPTDNNGDREYLFIFDADYTETPEPFFMEKNASADAAEFPTLYAMWPLQRGTMPFNPQDGQVFKITPNYANTPNDVFRFTAPLAGTDAELAKEDVEMINVFPNPYYGVNPEELNKYQRFVTFNHLPSRATIRIFNLAGQLVRTIEKDNPSQFQRWDLFTESGLPVASGLYIVHIDMPDLGKTKVLKAAVIQEQQILDRF